MMDAVIARVFKSQNTMTGVGLWVNGFFLACLLKPDLIEVSTNSVVALMGLLTAASGFKAFMPPDAPTQPAGTVTMTASAENPVTVIASSTNTDVKQ